MLSPSSKPRFGLTVAIKTPRGATGELESAIGKAIAARTGAGTHWETPLVITSRIIGPA